MGYVTKIKAGAFQKHTYITPLFVLAARSEYMLRELNEKSSTVA